MATDANSTCLTSFASHAFFAFFIHPCCFSQRNKKKREALAPAGRTINLLLNNYGLAAIPEHYPALIPGVKHRIRLFLILGSIAKKAKDAKEHGPFDFYVTRPRRGEGRLGLVTVTLSNSDLHPNSTCSSDKLGLSVSPLPAFCQRPRLGRVAPLARRIPLLCAQEKRDVRARRRRQVRPRNRRNMRKYASLNFLESKPIPRGNRLRSQV